MHPSPLSETRALDVAGRDSVHPLPDRLLAKLLHVVLGEARQRLPVVEAELLQQCEVGLLRLFEAGEDGPHRRHLERVGGDVLAADARGVVVLLVDLDLLGQLGDIRNVDLHRAVPQGFHELVVLKLPVFGLVRMPDDHLVDVGLRELLRLDLVLLGGPEEIVEKRHVQLQDLDELDEAAVRDVELAVEIEGSGIRIGAVFGDLAVVDVAGQLGRVLILLVLGLERADADAVLLGENLPAHPDVGDDLRPVAAIAQGEFLVVLTAGGAQVPLDRHPFPLRAAFVQHAHDFGPQVGGNQVQGLLMHRTGEQLRGLVAAFPARLAVQHPQPRDRRLGRSDRTVKQQDALLRSVPLGGGLEDVDQLHQRNIEAEDGVDPAVLLIVEEVVVGDFLLVLEVLARPLREDHVVDSLERGARHLRVVTHDLKIVLEAALPVLISKAPEVLELPDHLHDLGAGRSVAHGLYHLPIDVTLRGGGIGRIFLIGHTFL